MNLCILAAYFGLFLATTEGLVCYECANAQSNEECNSLGRLTDCPANALSCENLVRTRNGETLFFKQCKQPDACGNNIRGNTNGPQCRPDHPTDSECWCCCEGKDRCNEKALPCLQTNSTEQNPALSCEVPDGFENGRVDCSASEVREDGTYPLGSTCTYTCDPGYEGIGSSTTTCQRISENSDFTIFLPIPPTCVPILSPPPLTCEMPESPENGFIECDEPLPNLRHRIASRCYYTCNEGYKLEGFSIATCDYFPGSSTFAVFQPGFPLCIPETCAKIGSIENGYVECTASNEVGSECYFSCIDGYSLQPADITETKCLRNITWSNRTPCCLENCSPDAFIDLVIALDSSGSITLKNWDLMRKFTSNLVSNLKIAPDAANVGVFAFNGTVDESSRIFLKTYESNQNGLKVAIENIPYGGENGGTKTGNALQYARTTMFKNKNGDRPEAINVLLVITDGKAKDGPLLFSESKALRSKGVITFAIGIAAPGVSLDFSQLMEIAGSQDQLIILERGFEELGKRLADSLGSNICEERICTIPNKTPAAIQSTPPPPPTCAHPNEPENGRTDCSLADTVQNGQYLLSSTCIYFCNDGYSLDGPPSTTCQFVSGSNRNAEFAPPPPQCEPAPCAEVTEVSNAYIQCTNGNEIGSRCNYYCFEGYSIMPSQFYERKCLIGGKWNAPAPCCLRDCLHYALIDLVIVLDSSPTIGKKNWRKLLDFTVDFISNLKIGADAANVGVFRYNRIIDFSTRIFLNRFTNNKEALLGAVRKIPYNGKGRRTGRALEYARTVMFSDKNGNRPEATDAIITITGGRASDKRLVAAESNALRNDGVLTYAIGIDSLAGLDFEELIQIGGSVDQTIIMEDGFEGLSERLVSNFGGNECEPQECPTGTTGSDITLSPISTCEAPSNIDNGRVDCSLSEQLPDGRYLVTSTCVYICDEGYTLEGSPSTTCQYLLESNQEVSFSLPAPLCKAGSCKGLESITNGEIVCDRADNAVGTQCSFLCDDEHSLFPKETTEITCLENGKWSSPNPCCLQDCNPDALVDIIIILDSSSSIGPQSWKVMKKFTADFISNLNIRPDAANVGVFRYNSVIDETSAIFLNHFSNDRSGLINAVEKIPYNGEGTKTENALKYARTTMLAEKNGDRESAYNIVFVITDGKAEDPKLVVAEVKKLRVKGVITFAIGINPQIGQLDLAQLLEIAGSTGQLTVLEKGFVDMDQQRAKRLATAFGSNPCEPKSCN